LFYYFKSKYDLARECIFYGLNELWTKPFLARISTVTKPEDKIRELINFTIGLFPQYAKVIRFLIEMYEEELKRSEDRIEWRDFYKSYVQIIEKIFSECNFSNSKIKALILAACLDGLGIYYLLLGDDFYIGLEDLKKELFNFFVSKKVELIKDGKGY